MDNKSDKIGGKKLQGVVDKVCDDSTIKVRVEIKKAHPLYGKIVKSHKNFLAHKETDTSVIVGDSVEIQEVKPISKRKTFKLIRKN